MPGLAGIVSVAGVPTAMGIAVATAGAPGERSGERAWASACAARPYRAAVSRPTRAALSASSAAAFAASAAVAADC